MALATKEFSSKKQKILIAVLGGVILIILVVVYWGFWRSPAPPPSPASSSSQLSTPPTTSTSTPAVSESKGAGGALAPSSAANQSGVEAFIELRQLPAFQELRKFGRWPLPSEPKGRSDPFLVPPPTTEEELKTSQP